MKKENVLLFLLAAAVILVLASCTKKGPAEPAPLATKTATPTITVSPTISETSTSTPTFTVTETATPTFTVTDTVTDTPTSTATPTATCTITPDASSMLFGFEGGSTYNWIRDVGAAATGAVNLSSAQFLNGSQSLGVWCVYSSSDDLVQVMRSFEGFPINLSGKTIIFNFYVPAAMFAGGDYHPVASLVDYSGATLALTDGTPFPSSGWNQGVFTVPSDAAYEMIKEVHLGVKNDSNTLFYTGDAYIDDISW